jgi:hypothetical protein
MNYSFNVLGNYVCDRSSSYIEAYRTVFRINQIIWYDIMQTRNFGWAQVNGFRGETKELSEMKDRVDFDIWYIENWVCCWILKLFILPCGVQGEEKAY